MITCAKPLPRIMILLILLLWQILGTSSAHAAEISPDVCPDLKSTSCLKAIRSAIDNLHYGEARSMAELQCDASVDLVPSERLTESILTEQTLGCYYLFVLERFLGRSLRALDAHDRAKRMAVFGCEHGFASLCEVLLAFVGRNYDDLLAEVAAAIKNEGLGTRLIDVKLRSFTGGRELPASFVETAKIRLLKIFSDQRQPIGLRRTGGDGPPSRDLDAELVLKAGDLVLSLKIYDNLAKKIIWQQEWRTRDLEERRRLFGVNTEVPALMVATRRVDLWEPDYNIQFGLGGGSIPNTSGTVSDNQRLIVEIRAGERLGLRTWEAGMLVSAHFTEAGLNKNKIVVGEGEETDTDAETSGNSETTERDAAIEEARKKILTPYKSAYAFYLYLGRHLFGDLNSYKGVRGGATVGVGGVMTPYFMAGTARLGIDFQIGRRMVLTPAAYWIGGSAIPITKEVTVRTKEAVGGGLMISFAL